MRNRDGFTLMELMIVTVLIGILASLAFASFSGLREKSKTAATRVELRNVITAAERYRSVTGVLPATLDELVLGGFHRRSGNINYCQFERQNGPPADLHIEAAHRGSNLRLVARYPSWGTTMQETVGNSDCG